MIRRAAACLLLLAAPAHADDEPAGRDFPKTLTLDEPGIDDEVSLPTAIRIHHAAIGAMRAFTETDLGVEIDKRLTGRLDLQVNGAYSAFDHAGPANGYGWQNLVLTTKFVALDDRDTETIATIGLAREFGRTGAAGVGAADTGSTTPTLYAGQGLGAADVSSWLRPVALTATLGYALPDTVRLARQVQFGASLQYSLGYLPALPEAAQKLIPVVELTYALPAGGPNGADARRGFVAPGVFYAGDGFQLGIEALFPLTRASGGSVGVIAQLNLSFRALGLGALARPLF